MTTNSAVIDMTDVTDDGPHFQDFHSDSISGQSSTQHTDTKGMFGFSTSPTLNQTVTNMVWEAGKTHAGKAWNVYGNIDLLRPYFDVEPKDVMKRTINSLVPKVPTATPLKVHTELYGPTMLVLTLIALLLYEMKSSGHTVQEGTLIGTAFGTCFGYWFGSAALLWITAYVCNTHISFLQLLSLIGYSITAHCAVVMTSTVVHTTHDHMFFYLLWATFGGLSTLRMASILISRTHGPSQKLIVCAAMAAMNLLFLLYLHFAYHEIVEDLDEALKREMATHPENIVANMDAQA